VQCFDGIKFDEMTEEGQPKVGVWLTMSGISWLSGQINADEMEDTYRDEEHVWMLLSRSRMARSTGATPRQLLTTYLRTGTGCFCKLRWSTTPDQFLQQTCRLSALVSGCNGHVAAPPTKPVPKGLWLSRSEVSKSQLAGQLFSGHGCAEPLGSP
jgi:hypothetical protein